MKLFYSLFIASLLFFLSVSPSHGEETAEPREELVIGTMQEVDTTHPTFKIIKAAYAKIGYRIKLLPMPYARSFYESNRGELLDGELARTEDISIKASDMIRIPVPIDKVAATVFTNDPTFKPLHWQDMRGKRIDVLEGTDIVTGRLGDIPSNSVTTLEQSYLRLQSGRTDAMIVPGEIAQYVLDQMNLTGIYRVKPDLETWLVYHYIHKRHQDLVEPLTAALTQVMEHQPVAFNE